MLSIVKPDLYISKNSSVFQDKCNPQPTSCNNSISLVQVTLGSCLHLNIWLSLTDGHILQQWLQKFWTREVLRWIRNAWILNSVPTADNDLLLNTSSVTCCRIACHHKFIWRPPSPPFKHHSFNLQIHLTNPSRFYAEKWVTWDQSTHWNFPM